ncbi:MAG: hypothetical protein WBX16_24215 [Candidatus Acidiferrales bacterium]
MEPNRISYEEKEKISAANLHLFIQRHIHDYYPCATNSQRMCDFLESQYGMTIAQWPYPLHLEQIETAIFYLQSEHKLLPRPEAVEEVDEAAEEEARKQQKVRDDHAARVEAERIARARTIPIKQLAVEVAQQNNIFREQRERGTLPVRKTGLESRSLSTVKFGNKAIARTNVALQFPTLDRNGAEFARLYAEELQRLQGQQ